MIVREQKPIVFDNACNAMFEEWQLEAAILWAKSSKPVCRLKRVFLHGKYPAISIHGEKIHIHRLLMAWKLKRSLKTEEYVHHKDENRLNAKLSNLEIQTPSVHQSHHTKGRKFSDEHKRKLSLANSKRKGIKLKKHRPDIRVSDVLRLRKEGLSISKIAKKLNCGWDTVKARIYENPELLKPTKDTT